MLSKAPNSLHFLKKLSLYIHIPFCKTICLYCNFLTFAHKNKWIPNYIEALIKEIQYKGTIYQNYQIETIYFGGGTPSLIETEYIKKVLQTIHSNFQVIKKPEVSLECNPENVDTLKLEQYFHMGVTRLSLGVQTLDRKALFRIARPHDAKTIFKALDTIKKSPFDNFGADFIIGLPYQTLESFQNELDTILNYDPPHLSFYFLSYDTNRIDIFKSDCPTEDLQIDMYEYLIQKLKQADYLHYEVSNYAQPGFECLHNLRYWHQQEYVGLGLGSSSYINRTVFENTKNFEEYLQNPLTEPTEKTEIDHEVHNMEYILLHLRTCKGINKEDYQKKFKNYESLLKKAEEYTASGHVNIDDFGMRATEKGFLIIDKITQDFINAIQSNKTY